MVTDCILVSLISEFRYPPDKLDNSLCDHADGLFQGKKKPERRLPAPACEEKLFDPERRVRQRCRARG